MENNGLNINRPLLSVRRFSSVSSSHKIENKKTESPIPTRPNVEGIKTNSRSVPFGWEHSPGKPKNEKNKQVQVIESPPSVPSLPPGKFFKPRKMFKSKQIVDDNDDEVCMDALDSHCSASGGLGSDGKPSGLLRADPKMRDFMLGRFLPAARAMASDAPQHSFKKYGKKQKQPEVKRLVSADKDHKVQDVRYGPNFLQDVSDDKDEEYDDYDSDYEYHEHGKKSSRFCGLIPRFCAVNPVHGMCVKAKLPISPASRTQASSSSASSFRETDSEPARSGVYKQRSMSGVLKSGSIELPANLEGSKLYSRLQGPAISADLSGSIQSTVSEQSDSSSKKKGVSFRELLADKNRELLADKKNTFEVTETDSQDSIIEKTLYTVHVVESPKETSIPSCTKAESSFNASLESDVFADESKHDMKTRKYKGFDPDVELELFGDDDDLKGSLKWKDYDPKLFENPGPPPLPKSPSDSWLCRTLPSVSSKKAPATLWIPKCPSTNTLAIDPKTDENIQLQSPQEQMSPMPES